MDEVRKWGLLLTTLLVRLKILLGFTEDHAVLVGEKICVAFYQLSVASQSLLLYLNC
jgi:hypothetical protein